MRPESSEPWQAATTIGPDDMLVLVARQPMSMEQAQRIKDTMPAALKGRVVVVDGMEAYVVTA